MTFGRFASSSGVVLSRRRMAWRRAGTEAPGSASSRRGSRPDPRSCLPCTNRRRVWAGSPGATTWRHTEWLSYAEPIVKRSLGSGGCRACTGAIVMHPFEVGTVHWGYGQPRSADRGIRTNEVTHRFERNDHFDSTTKEQVSSSSLPLIGISGSDSPKTKDGRARVWPAGLACGLPAHRKRLSTSPGSQQTGTGASTFRETRWTLRRA